MGRGIKTGYEDLTASVLLATYENAVEEVNRLYYSGAHPGSEESQKAKSIKFFCMIEILHRLEARE